MRNYAVIILVILLFKSNLNSQIVIIESDSSGIQIPIIEQSAITNPTEGLIIYNSQNQLVEWWDREGFWVSLPSFKPFSSGIYTLDQRFFENRGNMLFTHVGAQQIDTTDGWGWGNTIMGVFAARSMTTSSGNTFFGHRTGENQRRGHANTLIGTFAGEKLDTSDFNVLVGYEAGQNLLRGAGNVAMGSGALRSVDTAYSNIAIGSDALQNGHKNVFANVAIGNAAMQNHKEGWDNIAIGNLAGQNSDTLYRAIMIGWKAGMNLNNGGNIMIGSEAGLMTTSGTANTFIGHSSGKENIDGVQNTFLGLNSGFLNVSGNNNTYIGDGAGFTNLGSDNILIGRLSGVKPDFSGANFSGNIFIGQHAGGNETGSNMLYIENSDSTTPLIKGDFSSDELRFNSSVTIRDALILSPRVPPTVNSACSVNGELLYGSTDHELYICKNGAWKIIQTN